MILTIWRTMLLDSIMSYAYNRNKRAFAAVFPYTSLIILYLIYYTLRVKMFSVKIKYK